MVEPIGPVKPGPADGYNRIDIVCSSLPSPPPLHPLAAMTFQAGPNSPFPIDFKKYKK